MQARDTAVLSRSQSSLARVVLIVLSVLFLATFLIVPVVSVLGYAFSQGLAVYLEALRAPDTLAAIRLTLHDGRDRRAGQYDLRRRGRLGDREVRFSRQAGPDHA